MSLSGANSRAGAAHVAAIECALEDAREELAPLGIDVRVNLADTQSDPNAASILLNSFLTTGLRITVGPYTSAEVAATEDRIRDSHGLLISPSSTALALSNRNDHIFRLAPNDSHLAESLVDLIWERGQRQLILVYRNDTWGNSLADEMEREFTSRGGTVVSRHTYDSAEIDVVAQILRQVEGDIDDLIGGAPTSSVAIQLTSLGEGTTFFQVAFDSVPDLVEVPWYGSDGFVKDWSIVSDSDLAEFAMGVDYTAPVYRVAVPDRFWHVIDRIEARTGVTPGAYTLLTYDATRVAARTLSTIHPATGYDELEAALHHVLADYVGVSGIIAVDATGDRICGEYDFYTVGSDGWSYWWERVEPST